MGRLVARALLAAFLRGLGLAAAALLLSRVEPARAPLFLAVWTACFAAPLLLLAPVEMSLTRWLLGEPAAGRGWRAAGRGALGALIAVVLLARRLPIIDAVGLAG